MVVYTKNEKNLVLPSSLGNFASNGGGSGVTPAEVQRMIDSSLTEYDETVQGYIADVDVDVEQNKEDIQDLSGTTSALTEGLNSLSGTVSSMGEEIVSLSGQTAQITAITAQIEALSGVTSGISNDLSSLGSDVEELSGVTSGIATDLQALSAYTESIVIPDMNDYTTTAVTAELSAATSGLAVELAELNQKVPNAVVLNLLTNEERKALYDEINPYFINGNLSSGFPVDKYEFFYWAGDGQIDIDNVRGFVRLDISKKMDGIVFAGNAGVVPVLWNRNYLYQIIYSYKIDSSGNGSLLKKEVKPYTLPTAAANTLGGVKVGSGLTIDGNGVLSVSGGTGGGIEKVDVLPLTAEDGDIVWLNGETKTGYTILCAETDASWPWELDRYYINVNGDDKRIRIGDFGPVGKWTEIDSLNNILVRVRLSSDLYPLLDVIDKGNNTIDKGSDAVSITSNVEFPMKGCLYVYKNNMWVAKPEFFWEYNSTEAQSVATKMFQGIEDFDIENFFIQYKCFINGTTRLLNFKAYAGAFYGNDFKSIDNNSHNNWDSVKVMCYRLTPAGAFSDLVGSKSMSVDDVIYDQIPYKVADSFKAIKIDSGGTIIDNTWDGLGVLGNMYKKSAMVEFEYEENNYFSAATIKYWYRQFEQVSGEDKLFYYCCAELPINGTVYKGIWKWEEYNYPNPFTPISWTQVQ